MVSGVYVYETTHNLFVNCLAATSNADTFFLDMLQKKSHVPAVTLFNLSTSNSVTPSDKLVFHLWTMAFRSAQPSITRPFMLLFALLCASFYFTSDLSRGIPSSFLADVTIQRRIVPITHNHPPPIEGACTIMRCANRSLPYVQQLSHPLFNYLFLDISKAVEEKSLWPGWCRIPHLQDLRSKGHTCVAYVDDDIFVNLTRISEVAAALPKDFIAVGTNDNHGIDHNINSGFILFTNIQGPFSNSILNKWREAMDGDYYHSLGGRLYDQRALNDVMNCNMTNTICYHLSERYRFGLLAHCHSNLNIKKGLSAKRDCMRAKKKLVREWDSDPL